MTDSYTKIIRGAYMPHVDGMRALAVLAVVLYHLHESWLPAGYVGVDIFFVISGYLIGGGILRDLRADQFSFSDFYTRRIKRIMPAYFAMITVTIIAGLFLFHYELLASLGSATYRAAYFFANFFFYKYTGSYFAGDATSHPLTNLWSLSVEEQFYIIIPFLMWLIWKFRAKALLPTLGLLFIISLVHAETLMHSASMRAHIQVFYLLAPRAWELLGGCILAGLTPMSQQRQALAGRLLAPTGLILIFVSFFTTGACLPFPGIGLLPVIIGAALLIRYGGCGVVSSLLSHRVTVWLGRISYSLYLWHWPVIVYTRYIYGKELSLSAQGIAFGLSFLLAVLSWRYVEMPVRRSKSITPAKAFCGLLLACFLTGGVGYYLKKEQGLVHVLHPEAHRFVSLEYPPTLPAFSSGDYGIQQLNNVPDEKGKKRDNVLKRLGDDRAAPQYVLIGDSHAEALQIGLDDSCRRHGISGLAVDAKTCPLSGIEITNTFSNLTEPFIEWLSGTPNISTVILMCRWSTRLSNGNSQQILYRKGEQIPTDSENNSQLLEEGLRETCRRIKALGKELILIGPVPHLRFSPGTEVRRRIILHQSLDDLNESISLQEFEKEESFVIRMLRDIEKDGLARVIWTHPCLEQNGRFYGLMNNALFYHDEHHLSGDGSRHVITSIFEQLFQHAGK